MSRQTPYAFTSPVWLNIWADVAQTRRRSQQRNWRDCTQRKLPWLLLLRLILFPSLSLSHLLANIKETFLFGLFACCFSINSCTRLKFYHFVVTFDINKYLLFGMLTGRLAVIERLLGRKFVNPAITIMGYYLCCMRCLCILTMTINRNSISNTLWRDMCGEKRCLNERWLDMYTKIHQTNYWACCACDDMKCYLILWWYIWQWTFGADNLGRTLLEAM